LLGFRDLMDRGQQVRPVPWQPRWRGAPVKKLLLLVLVGAGVFAVWRKVQADRAELDLWTEATTDDD
jgi:hypothetical protein